MGIDYYEEKSLFKELFIQEINPLPLAHEFETKKQDESYIYIISKKVDDRTFLKIGFSTLMNGRRSRSFSCSFHNSHSRIAKYWV